MPYLKITEDTRAAVAQATTILKNQGILFELRIVARSVSKSKYIARGGNSGGFTSGVIRASINEELHEGIDHELLVSVLYCTFTTYEAIRERAKLELPLAMQEFDRSKNAEQFARVLAGDEIEIYAANEIYKYLDIIRTAAKKVEHEAD